MFTDRHNKAQNLVFGPSVQKKHSVIESHTTNTVQCLVQDLKTQNFRYLNLINRFIFGFYYFLS